MRHAWILLLAACGSSAEPPAESGPSLGVEVAALSLAGIDDACYGLTVYAGGVNAPVVWTRQHVCSREFGDGRGSLGYVGPCDASVPSNTVQLVVEDLCSGGACSASTALTSADWVNPCPAPGGCLATAVCSASNDTPVRFDLTIARAANQGFFDVAVTFDDLFCSGKFDCEDAQGQPMTLLFDPATSQRGPTVVMAWACTAGPGSDTYLYYDNVVITCFDDGDQVIGTWPYDPSLGPGNAGPGAAPFVFQTATYRTTDQNGVASWNMAFGIHPDDLPGRCVLEAQGTASNGPLTEDQTPTGAVYPVVHWNVELSSEAGALSCGRHPLNGPDGVVSTGYARGTPEVFSHALKASAMTVSSHERKACGQTITALDGKVSFALAPEGMTARVGGEQSPFYRMPEGYGLQGCCGDPCCAH